MMETTVLIENAVTMVVVGIALHRSHKTVLLTILIAVIAHMAFDNTLLTHYKPKESVQDNFNYYFLTSLFFLMMFGMFIAKGVKSTKLSVIMALCMITQATLSFLVAINGATFGHYSLYEFEFVYAAHKMFNNGIWVIECIVAWTAFYDEKAV